MARQRSIYDASYQTPLADFLEQIPDYFLKWEALKLQNKKYDNEQAYRAARDLESDRRWTLTQQNQIHQRDFDAKKLQLSDELKQISMAPIKQQDALYEKIKPTYIKHPEFTGLIDSRISANDAVEGVADKHLDIQSKISDYKGLGKSGRFGSYYDMLEDKQELSKLGKEVQGTSYQSLIDADIAKLDGWLEFSKQNADKPMPKNLWEYELDRTNYNQTAQQRSADMKAADALSGEIATAKSNLITLEGDTESVAYKSALDGINQKEAQLINLVGGTDADGNEIKGRIAESNATLYGIEQNNKWNQLGGTTKVLEGGVFGYEPKTEMKEQDVEKYILNNPEEGFDAWMDFVTNPSEESENKFSLLLNDFIENENKVEPPLPPPTPAPLPSTVKDAMAIIDRKKQGLEPDVDLAETGDDKIQETVKDKDVKIPTILGGLQAQDKTVAKEVDDEVEIFPEGDDDKPSEFNKKVPSPKLRDAKYGIKYLRSDLESVMRDEKMLSDGLPNKASEKNMRAVIKKKKDKLRDTFLEIYDKDSKAFYDDDLERVKKVRKIHPHLKDRPMKYREYLTNEEFKYLISL